MQTTKKKSTTPSTRLTAQQTSKSSAETPPSQYSLANAEAAANSHSLLLFQFLGGSTATTLPYPLGNCISGGQHAHEEKAQTSKNSSLYPMAQKLS